MQSAHNLQLEEIACNLLKTWNWKKWGEICSQLRTSGAQSTHNLEESAKDQFEELGQNQTEEIIERDNMLGNKWSGNTKKYRKGKVKGTNCDIFTKIYHTMAPGTLRLERG